MPLLMPWHTALSGRAIFSKTFQRLAACSLLLLLLLLFQCFCQNVQRARFKDCRAARTLSIPNPAGAAAAVMAAAILSFGG